MRNVWISALLVPLFLSLTASEAAQEPEGPELKVLSSEAEYVGPVFPDASLQQRLAEQRNAGTGVINVYNVWTSFQKVKLKNNLSIVGHSYRICLDRHSTLYFGNLIFNGGGPIQVRLQIKLNKGGGTFLCDYNVTTDPSRFPWK